MTILRNAVAAPAAAAPAGATFGTRMNLANIGAKPASEEKPKAKIWMNVGLMTGDEEYPFAALPFGIPVDTQEPLTTGRNSKNEKYREFVALRNQLLDEFQKAGTTLQPGEEIIFPIEGTNLAVQLRRVDDESEQTPAQTGKHFAAFELRLAS